MRPCFEKQYNFSYIFSNIIHKTSVARTKKLETFLLWNKNYIRVCSGSEEIKQCKRKKLKVITIRFGYKNSSMPKTEVFVTTVNDWKPLTNDRKMPFLNVGGFLNLSVALPNFADLVFFIICKISSYIWLPYNNIFVGFSSLSVGRSLTIFFKLFVSVARKASKKWQCRK